MNDRLDFILTVIKQDNNTNDRLKIILLFIKSPEIPNTMTTVIQKEKKKLIRLDASMGNGLQKLRHEFARSKIRVINGR